MSFVLHETYELKDKWKKYFDLQQDETSRKFTGYYYTKVVGFPEPGITNIAYCLMLNEKGEQNPLFATRFPIVDFEWVVNNSHLSL